jgi:hypothetical protein
MGKSRSYLEKHLPRAGVAKAFTVIEQWVKELEKPENWQRFCYGSSPDEIDEAWANLELINAFLLKPPKVARK